MQLRTYQKWEKGETIPDGYNLIKLMNYLNIETVQNFIVNEPIYDDGFEKFKAIKFKLVMMN
ncbi:MAG: helix-turn-helix transcriptional regulator [Clostridia bacterium]|nr:helix-turn-helix transcriptional regulator [Clostridia bacterium]